MVLYSKLTGNYLVNHCIELHFSPKHSNISYIIYALINEISNNALDIKDVIGKYYVNKPSYRDDLKKFESLNDIIKNAIKQTLMYKLGDFDSVEIYRIQSNGFPTSGSYCANTTYVAESIDDVIIMFDNIWREKILQIKEKEKYNEYVKKLNGNVKYKADPLWELVKLSKEKEAKLTYDHEKGGFDMGFGTYYTGS